MRTALVTGASSGMGKETAKMLLDKGFAVYAVARRVDRMADLEKLGAVTLRMDITRDEDVQAVVDRVTAERGGVDVLVNNAGFGLYGAVEDTAVADARYQFEVNLFGLSRLTQLVVPHMREQGYGRIVNVSSIGGKIYTPLGAWYHATKHALEGWSDALRLELAPFGIDVVIIEPGLIETEFGDVTVEPMLKRSGSSAYAGLAGKVASATRANYEPGKATPASRLAEVIVGSITARRPRTRYVAGKYGRPLVTLRKWLSDRAFDRVVMRALGA
ncbi:MULTISPECIES: oxidoreductase [unclassified Streptomyces]|uniref:oxidoreductase n=1 Tax=unclassified Streptomyces TaxID=2593676 RepID=UPI0022B6B990|nr:MULTISPECIES: oxidoreductase [unclassified Streptomyces]MCZ7415706.1 oxidoreductase [Streptomyces sp. WMMC897]MCZ7434483.1 oxidoreductase [Streptomyces sp. WMMC1477]